MKLLLIIWTAVLSVLVLLNTADANDLRLKLLWQTSNSKGCIDGFDKFNEKYNILINNFGGISFNRGDVSDKTCEEMHQKYINASKLLANIVIPDFLNWKKAFNSKEFDRKVKVILLIHKAMINAKVININGADAIVLNANHPDVSLPEELKIIISHEWQHIINMQRNTNGETFADIAADEGLAVRNSMFFLPSVKISKLLMMAEENLDLCIKKIKRTASLSELWLTNDIGVLQEWFVGSDLCVKTGCRCGYLVGFCSVEPANGICKKFTVPNAQF